VIGPSTKENRSAALWQSAIAKHPINLIAR